jgi:hypothetical protein
MTRGTRFVIEAEPIGENYDQLLRFVARHADTFSLTITKFTRKSASAMAALTALKPFEIEERETSRWPGTELLPPHKATLYVFRSEPRSIEVLQAVARSLYAWQGPAMPDDLCFYRRDGSEFLTSTAHEAEADLFLVEAEYGDLHGRLPDFRIRVAVE